MPPFAGHVMLSMYMYDLIFKIQTLDERDTFYFRRQ